MPSDSLSGHFCNRFLATKSKNPYSVIDEPQEDRRSKVVSRTSISSVSDPVSDYQSQVRCLTVLKAQEYTNNLKRGMFAEEDTFRGKQC